MRFIASIIFFLVSTASAQSLDCKITQDGEVALTHYVEASDGDLQQMIKVVGKETWQNPNHARPKCEELKSKFVIYKGEKWGEPYCICRGNFQNKLSVFASLEGEEIELEANNFYNYFRGFNRHESFSRQVNIYIPGCENVCWP